MRVVNFTNERMRSIPLTVIDGLHGAGKSTLVRHTMCTAKGQRVTAVVRDLEPLIAECPDVERVGSVARWPNQSTAIETDDPTATLALLARKTEPPEHVLVESTGTANPRRLGGYGYMPGFRPDGLITVVDACTVLQKRDDRAEEAWLASLRLADFVVLNKADVAGREMTAAAQRAIQSFAPQARFVWSTNGRVAPPLLLGAHGVRAAEERTVVAEWHPEYPSMRGREARSLVGEHCRCWCLLRNEPISSREFRAWVGHLPKFILRAGGSVYLEQEPRYRHDFSLIGMRWSLTRGAPWADDVPSTRITIVGTDGSRGESARLIRRAATELESEIPEAVL